MIAFLLAAWQPQAAPPVTSAPPAGQQFLQWRGQDARCGGVAIAARKLHQPHPILVSATAPPSSILTLRFRIDGNGRPLSIGGEGLGNPYMSADVVPSLAASTFAVAGPQQDCTIRYFPVRTPLEVVDRQALLAYSMIPGTTPLPRDAWQRMQPGASDCGDRPTPRVRLRAYPDFLSFPGTRGTRDWTIVRYDLNARGRPINVDVSDHSGNAALNAASVRAVRSSRFTPGARANCSYRYWREAETVAPPPSPAVATLRPADATCPPGLEWTNRLSLSFPPAFLHRRVEGWAIIAYDVASWGDVGNLRVLASEPADGFGTQAMSIIRRGKKAPSERGYTGCVEKVRFAVSANDLGSSEDHRVAAD